MGKKAHLKDFFRLRTFIDHVQFTAARLLIVSDRNGQLGGCQALKGVTFTARPVVDVLVFHREDQKEKMLQIAIQHLKQVPFFIKKKKKVTYHLTPVLDHLSQLNDEAVSFVEAGPRHWHLFGSDMATALNVQQAREGIIVCHHMLEA